MAPRSVFLAAALIGATLVHGSPNPFAMPKAFAQTDSMPECLSDCLLEYGASTSAQQCLGDIDPDTATMDEQMTVIDCWCTDSSRAGTSLDRCTASCTDGGAEFWESVCMSVGGGGGSPPADDEEDPLEEESTSSTPSRPTRTVTTETEEETDFIDAPTDTDDTDSPVVTEDEEPTDTVDDEEEDVPTSTRVRRPTPPAEVDDDSSAQQFLPHAGALVAGLFAAVVAL